ncbi:NnrS family protein (plasmid) [Leisingera caerulea]|uniref:NnrS family protein n=1 Tax=Leisingera caerulea TaxID=506591 RepID=UPI0021A7B30A|nr:NnrS family protein [Leisingera caerulea]UWQ52142.1 NnrS family protein [Leisingera caerulea]
MISGRDFSAFWDAPHRPLFLSAFLCALLTVAWWPLGVRLGLPAPAFPTAVLWHVHELIFGFAAAAIGGYLLTALPGWTAQPPLRGTGLKALTLTWVLARIAIAGFEALPFAVPLLLNAAFFLGLSVFLCRQIAAAKAYRKLGLAAAVPALGAGEAVFLTGAAAGDIWGCLALARIILTGLILLMFSAGARAVPAFTRNWLAQQGYSGPPLQGWTRLCFLPQGLLALVVVLTLAGCSGAAHAALIASAVTMLWTMKGWRTCAALRNPLLAAQHMAFLWLPLGALAIGAAGLGFAGYPMAAAVHAITIGAMPGLIMAIAGRAACHATDGTMRAGSGFKAGVVLVWLTAWVRLAVPLFPAHSETLTTAAALLWCAGWLAFVAGFLPALSGPVRRPVLSGRSVGKP